MPGGFIVTAAHCINWDATGGMALGDSHFEKIKASNGTAYVVCPYAVEPVLEQVRRPEARFRPPLSTSTDESRSPRPLRASQLLASRDKFLARNDNAGRA